MTGCSQMSRNAYRLMTVFSLCFQLKSCMTDPLGLQHFASSFLDGTIILIDHKVHGSTAVHPIQAPDVDMMNIHHTIQGRVSCIAVSILIIWLSSVELMALPEFYDCTKAYHNWFQEILNSMDVPWTNGYIEGCNNKTKVLKRISYGMRNFDHFRKRILFVIHKKSCRRIPPGTIQKLFYFGSTPTIDIEPENGLEQSPQTITEYFLLAV